MENGHLCPECGTERAAPDGDRPGSPAPTCDCARRAADAHHAQRTAAIADAEDFNPLRIRPYVNLGRPNEDTPQDAQALPAYEERGHGDGAPDPGHTMPLRTVGAPYADGGPTPSPGGPAPHDGAPTPPESGPTPQDGGATPQDGSPAQHDDGPSRHDHGPARHDDGPARYDHGPARHDDGPARYDHGPARHDDGPARYDHGPAQHDDGPPRYDDAPRRRRSRGSVLLAATAAAVILTGAAFAVGAFDSDTDRPRALPAGGTPTAAPTPVAEPSAGSSPSRSASASVTPTAAPSRTAHPSPTRASRSATPTQKPTPPPSRTPTAPASSAIAPPPSKSPAGTRQPASLAQGSSGPDVRELQDRLSQVWLYRGPLDGRYTSRVTSAVASYQSRMGIDDDPEGVYGPATRASLEGFTEEP